MAREDNQIKFKFAYYAWMWLICNLLWSHSTTQELTNLHGPYLGQKPPGKAPELFAPGIVSTGAFEHSSPVFTSDLSEMYWSTIVEEQGKVVARPTYAMKMVKGVWSKPYIPAFARQFRCCENPFISPSGATLYFTACNEIPPEHFELYRVDRVAGEWGAPVKLAETINAPDHFAATPSVAGSGTLYFTGDHGKAGTGFGLYYSRWCNGLYLKPEFMAEKFNSLQADWTPYIAPDENYLIFSSGRPGGLGSCDLYICFKQKDGTWGNVINLGSPINSERNERFPNVTPDGKYLFFNSTRKIAGAGPDSPGNGSGDIYWVDAGFITELKKKNWQNRTENGINRRDNRLVISQPIAEACVEILN